MKKFQITSLLPLGIILLLIFSSGCSTSSQKPNDRIPITTSSDQARADYNKGMAMINNLRTPDAVQYFNSAISEDSNFAMAYLALAQTQSNTNDFLKDLNKAISLTNKVSQPESLMIMGAEGQFEGNPSQAKANYEKLVSLYPNDPQALNLLGNYYFGQQQDDQAISEFTKATQVDSSYTPSYNSLGYAYMREGKYDDAEKAFKKYTELIPDEPNPYDSYAELLMKEGKYNESIQNYQKALSKDPNFNSSHIGIAADYMYQGNYDDARDALQKLFDSTNDPGFKENAKMGIIITYVDQWKPDMALKQLDELEAMDKKNNDTFSAGNDLFNKSNIFFEMGKYDDALKASKDAHDMLMSPSLPQSIKDNIEQGLLLTESYVAAMKKDFKTANEDAQKILQQSMSANNQNQINEAHKLMGFIDIQQKKADDALSELSKANQQDPYVSYLMVKAYMLKHDKANAKKAADAVMNFNGIPTLNSALARAKTRMLLKSI
jgi:tetratricopeptide (TPR) repeat protein